MLHPVQGVLAVEGEQTGDGRVIVAGGFDWADLPLPLMDASALGGHSMGAFDTPQVGNIVTARRDGSDITFTGHIDDETPGGADLVRRMQAGSASHGNRQGLSVDPDNWRVELLVRPDDGEDEALLIAGAGPLPALTAAAGDPDPDDNSGEYLRMWVDDVDDAVARFTRLRIRGVTACPIPAFAGAYMELTGGGDSDDSDDGDGVQASADTPVRLPLTLPDTAPDPAVFSIPEPDLDAASGALGAMVDVYGMPVTELMVEQPDGGIAVPFTVVEHRGQLVCYGHAARWGQCHIGYSDGCVTAPASRSGYAHFHVGQVHAAGGQRIATGPLTLGCDHAAAELRAPAARDHYANAGLAFADVRAVDGALGVWVSGVLRPDVTAEQLYLIRASSLSGDWRRIGTDLEMVGALAVNIPGFPVAREAITAAGVRVLPVAGTAAHLGVYGGEQVSLTAAGVVHRCPDCQRRAMANDWAPAAAADPDRQLRLLETIEHRTRHLVPAAAQAALARIRR